MTTKSLNGHSRNSTGALLLTAISVPSTRTMPSAMRETVFMPPP